MSSLLSLAPSGVFQRSLLPIEPVRSYHTFSPLPCYGGIFSVALSLGLPPPGITWHCILAEPGLSSLKLIKATSHLSGRINLLFNINFSIDIIHHFKRFLLIIKHSWSTIPFIRLCLNLLWKDLIKIFLWLIFEFLILE